MGLFSNTQKSIQDMIDSSQGVLRNILDVFGEMEEEYAPRDQGVSLEDAVTGNQEGNDFYKSQSYGNLKRYVAHEEMSKEHKLSVYRQMSEYPEIDNALNTITDEIIAPDKDGSVAELNIRNERLLSNLNIKDNLMKEWEYVYHELFDFDHKGWNMTYNFLVNAEIFIEKVHNPQNKDKGITNIKKLMPDEIFVNWDTDGEPHTFKVNVEGKNEPITVGKHQITYANFGQFAYNSATKERIALGYLEKIKKIWRQLQLLEEAVIIYRVVRAPEKRIFNIATGNMPKHKQEEYIQKIMRQYRQKKIYKTNTGEIDGQANIQNMLEDYFFSVPENGGGSSVDTLAGGEQLGEITDLDYFLKKLYRALQIPESRRMDEQSTFNGGQLGDVTHQEVKFMKMVKRITCRMKETVMDVFFTHLKMKGLWKEYGLKERDFEMLFHQDHHYEEYQEANVMETRMRNFADAGTYIGQVFSKEFAQKKFLCMTDQEIEENKQRIKKEKEEGELEGFDGGF
mgnify:CR=1 FL=1